MTKVGRNEPCPCGSGKKYKKCCGNNKSTANSSAIVKEELDQAFQRFQDYVVNEYPHLLPSEPPQTQEEHLDHFFALLQTSIFETQQDGETIMGKFVDYEKRFEHRPLTAESIAAWVEAKAGVFRLERNIQDVIVKNVFDETEFTVARESIPVENLEATPYYLGILLQWGHLHQFMPIAIPETEEKFEIYKEKFDHEYEKAGTELVPGTFFGATLAKQFRRWIQTEKASVSPSESKLKPKEREVLELLETKMEEETYREAQKIWESFCNQETATIQKSEVFAATLDYLLAEDVSQKTMADKHGVSPNSISRRAHQLKAYQ